jgi:hypothetical protein
MRVIYKYPINTSLLRQEINAAINKIIHVGIDPTGVPCIWAEVDNADYLTKVAIYIIPTGECAPLGPGITHIGSFIEGPYVWHVYY